MCICMQSMSVLLIYLQVQLTFDALGDFHICTCVVYRVFNKYENDIATYITLN
jgi:hypothetical protein